MILKLEIIYLSTILYNIKISHIIEMSKIATFKKWNGNRLIFLKHVRRLF